MGEEHRTARRVRRAARRQADGHGAARRAPPELRPRARRRHFAGVRRAGVAQFSYHPCGSARSHHRGADPVHAERHSRDGGQLVAAQGGPMTALLTLDNVSRRFGGLNAVNGVSFSVEKGEIVGLIGPNGAGKTTLINLITGVHPATAGRVNFEGQDITRAKPYQIARQGLARTFQIVQPFPKMTVVDNVAAGALFCGHAGNVREAQSIAREHLAFTGLADMADQPAASLTLARRKRLELAKGLAMRPRLLMLDEVNAGLNQTEVDDAVAIIRKIAEQGVTIIVIEHVMKVVLSISHRLVVLHHGQLISQGTPRDVVNDSKVIEAYLGARYAAANPRGTH